MANIEEKVENSISKIIENLGYKLYDVQYAKEGKDYFLRIFIEKENGELTHQEQAFLKEYKPTQRRCAGHDGKSV